MQTLINIRDDVFVCSSLMVLPCHLLPLRELTDKLEYLYFLYSCM